MFSSLQVLSGSACPASLPLDAVCLCGLELRGASWDAELGALQDTVCVEPCVLPLVCVKAQVKNTDASLEASSCKSLHNKDCSNVQVAHASDMTEFG